MIVDSITYSDTAIGDFSVRGYISARLMAAYDFAGHTLHVAPINEGAGRVFWRYVLESDGRVIFDGEDFSSGSALSPAEAARSILSFLTLREGDTDAEYFDTYTPAQLEWRDEHAENLSIYAID